MESCALYDEQASSVAGAGDDHVPVGDPANDPAVGQGAVVGLGAADDPCPASWRGNVAGA